MKLTDKTWAILDNFSSIQRNIVFSEGNELKTMAEAKNILAKATLDQSFPKEFGIYDLKEFLSAYSMLEDPSLTFEEDYVSIQDVARQINLKYYYSSRNILTSPEKNVQMPHQELLFDLSEGTLSRIKHAASVFGHEKLVIYPSETREGCVTLTVTDPNDATSNSFSVDVPADWPQQDTFKFILNISNLKLMPNYPDGSVDYVVGISKLLLSNFKSKRGDLEYFIALEKSSTYTPNFAN